MRTTLGTRNMELTVGAIFCSFRTPCDDMTGDKAFFFVHVQIKREPKTNEQTH